MQWTRLKIIGFLLPALLSIASPASSQFSNFRLQQADSLFNKKQYTQSLAHYETILKQNQFSPAMLMKMAFIEEGLDRIGPAMYYLNLYYIHSGDQSALLKMQELSTKYQLAGYDDPTAEHAYSSYRRYQQNISIALAAIIFFFFSLFIYLRRKKRKPVVVFVVIVWFSCMLLAHLHLSDEEAVAIISDENTYVMDGPSGAAPVVAIVTPGHRLNIVGKKDVWVAVEWGGRTGYIRENFLLPVNAL